MEKQIGLLVTGRAEVEVVYLAALGCLAGSEKRFDGRQPRLQPQPARELDRARIRDEDAELAHAGLEPSTVPALGLIDLEQELGAVGILPAAGDQLVDRARFDLAPPGLEQTSGDGVVPCRHPNVGAARSVTATQRSASGGGRLEFTVERCRSRSPAGG
jgi:hypothetical protein